MTSSDFCYLRAKREKELETTLSNNQQLFQEILQIIRKYVNENLFVVGSAKTQLHDICLFIPWCLCFVHVLLALERVCANEFRTRSSVMVQRNALNIQVTIAQLTCISVESISRYVHAGIVVVRVVSL